MTRASTSAAFLFAVALAAACLPEMAAARPLPQEGSVTITAADGGPWDAPEGFASKLFIHTQPMGAAVRLDGVLLPGRTPMLIEAPPEGARTIGLEMTGYAALEFPIILDHGGITAVESTLAPTGITVLFQDGINLGPRGSKSPPGGYSLPPGVYSVDHGGDGPIFAPEYPHQRWIKGLSIAIPLVTALTAGVMVAEASNPSTDGIASPFTIGAAAADLALIGIDAVLIIRRSRWRESWRADPAAAASLWANEDFAKTEHAMETGKWDEARSSLDAFAARYPLDGRTPEALYRSARLAYVQGDVAVCAERLGVLLERYPVPELWGRVQRLRADLAFRSGRTEEGLAALDAIYGFDAAVDLEAVAYQKAQILSDLSRESGNKDRAAEAWDALIEKWPQSPLIDEYRRFRNALIDSPESSQG